MFDFNGTVAAIKEDLFYSNPSTEADALDTARDCLSQYISDNLIYTADILELWDGSTHDNIELEDYDDLMAAVTASTLFQLEEEWGDAIFDALDSYIDDMNVEHVLDLDMHRDRDEYLDLIYEARENAK